MVDIPEKEIISAENKYRISAVIAGFFFMISGGLLIHNALRWYGFRIPGGPRFMLSPLSEVDLVFVHIAIAVFFTYQSFNAYLKWKKSCY